ncbi:4-alpha-glucanotransferase [Christensenellaceae bacterium OttesenSCG-928-M15]|nr:4-alpha-glucanotransferase [Christensenellaceae bacterium OttesenSCG-928-M15]
MERASGILMHISSLPSKYGIGTLGREAFRFVDFLKRAGQKYWQVLPVGHTGFGDSPYQVFSMFAGNPNFIDLEMLIEQGLLNKKEVEAVDWGEDGRYVEYGKIYESRANILKSAYMRAGEDMLDEMNAFRAEEADWVEDYALFMALKQHFHMRSFLEWDDRAIRLREPEAVARYKLFLQNEITFYIFVQYLFFKQWAVLRAYVKEAGIKLIGDIPIYVAPDSADVWVNPQYFQLDEERFPTAVAGVPPDYFSATGQLWGNPLYDWERVKADGYRLWRKRFSMASRQFDVVRIDHFRGFESYWSIPFGEKTAMNGKWVKGPGLEALRVLQDCFPQTEIIAEDLGQMTEGLREFVNESGLPGMKVLQFAFDSKEQSNYLPHSYQPFCVCYTGTHDNTTAGGWLTHLSEEDEAYARAYLGLHEAEGTAWGLIRGGMASVASLFIMQMQDCLELSDDCRMNLPGTIQGNWRWRCSKEEISNELADKLRYFTYIYGRTYG